ncbi:MAG: hypothetical protein JST17_13570 [Bacteroidetes bacterium]|nr:hypothetical protein [Bacteroidota bacterium]MBS1930954.1 hypothetical protein [Bacteroidota bacterium]
MTQVNSDNTSDVLKSIEGIKKVSAPDFFYTRLRARMEKETDAPIFKKGNLKSAFIFSGLVLLVLINMLVLFKNNEDIDTLSTGDNDNIQVVANDYHINNFLQTDLNP